MNEGFRLTPADIRAQEFGRSMFGYSVTAVEDFRARAAEEMERLVRERAMLEERLQNLREQLKAYREQEKALNNAVLLAQQVRSDTEVSAKQQSDLVIREAGARAEQILGEARAAEGHVRREIEEAQRLFSGYLAAFRQLLWRHLAEVDALAEHERDGTPPNTP